MPPQIQTTSKTNTRLAVATLILAAAAGLAFAATLIQDGPAVCVANENSNGITINGSGDESQDISNTCVGANQVLTYTCADGAVGVDENIFISSVENCGDGAICAGGVCIAEAEVSLCVNTDSGVTITNRSGGEFTINNYCSGNTPVTVSCDAGENGLFTSAQGDACADGQVCQGGTCVADGGQVGQQDGQNINDDCNTNIDCVADLYCNNNGTCQVRAEVGNECANDIPCLTHLECEENVCKIPGGIAGCSDGNPCAGGFACGADNVCLASVNAQCQDAADCATGVCNDTGQCTSCVATADWQGNNQCENGSCVFECQADNECAADETCSAQNTCLVPAGAACQADADCAAGTCVNAKCVLSVGDACTGDNQCVNNQCSNGVCVGPSSGGSGPSSGSSRGGSASPPGTTTAASGPQCRIIE